MAESVQGSEVAHAQVESDDEILEADVGQFELDADTALEFGAGKSDFGT